MTTFVEARDAIVSFIEANITGISKFYEDTEAVDLDTVDGKFLKICVEFTDGYQASIGADPLDRTLGFIVFSVFTRDGTGSRTALQTIDVLKAAVQYQLISGVQLEAVRPGDVERKDGWVNRELLVPFWFDSIS